MNEADHSQEEDVKFVFVSYSSDDTKQVDGIIEELKKRGIAVWIDHAGILGARLWREEIVHAIQDCAAFLIFLSPNSVASRHVRAELELGDQYDKAIIPLFIANTDIPDNMALPLAGIQFIDGTPPCTKDEILDNLENTLTGCHSKRRTAHTEEIHGRGRLWWRGLFFQFGLSSLFAATLVLFISSLVDGRADIPDSLTGLLPVFVMDGGIIALSVLVFCLIIFLLVIWLRPWVKRRPLVSGFILFLATVLPVTLYQGNYLASLFAVISICVIAYWRSRFGGDFPGLGVLVIQVLILAGAPALGVALSNYKFDSSSQVKQIMAVTRFEIDSSDEGLRSFQKEISNKLRDILALVFEKGDIEVQPVRFVDETMDHWRYAHVSKALKASQLTPHLVLKNTVSRCSTDSLAPNASQPASYTWLEEPYGKDFEPMPEYIRFSGSNSNFLSINTAFRLLTITKNYLGFSPLQEMKSKKVIVQELLTQARIEENQAVVTAATDLLRRDQIDDQMILGLLEQIGSVDKSCEKAAKRLRNFRIRLMEPYAKHGTGFPEERG